MPEETSIWRPARLDVIAVGAHPDDVDIGCGGILARLAEQGYRVGIVDLTDGEPTPASPGPEVRLAEVQRAAQVLGCEVRVTLDLPNRRLFDTFEARVALAKQFRKFRPRLVLGLGSKTPLASPDHYQAMLITEAAVFYSRLTKWDEHFENLPVHTVPQFLCYFLGLRTLSRRGRTCWWSTSAARWKRRWPRSSATRRNSRPPRRKCSTASGPTPWHTACRPVLPPAKWWPAPMSSVPAT